MPTPDELFDIMSKERYFPNVSQEFYVNNAHLLKADGFLDWEVMHLASHDMTSYAVISMRIERIADFDDFMRSFLSSFPNQSLEDAYKAWDAEILGRYFDNGWVFKATAAPNPFDYLHTFYQPDDPSTISPSRRTQRRKPKDYATVKGKI